MIPFKLSHLSTAIIEKEREREAGKARPSLFRISLGYLFIGLVVLLNELFEAPQNMVQ